MNSTLQYRIISLGNADSFATPQKDNQNENQIYEEDKKNPVKSQRQSLFQYFRQKYQQKPNVDTSRYKQMELIGDYCHIYSKNYYKDHQRILLITSLKVNQLFSNNNEQEEFICDNDENLIKHNTNERITSFIRQTLILIRSLFLVWSPEDPKRVFFDIISMIFIFIQLLTIPVIIAFQLEIQGDFKVFDSIMDYYFIVDLFLCFNTGYYERGTLIKSRSKIVLNYLKFWFWIDLVASFPYDDTIQAFQSDSSSQADMAKHAQLLKFIRFLKFVKVVRLLRALKLKKFFSKLEEYISITQTLTSLLSFLKLCLLILCVAHWCACIFYLIGEWQGDSTGNWMAKYDNGRGGIWQDDWTIKYITALYYSITTMITIGYGDVHPWTTYEQVFSIFMMIMASGMFGYTMNSIMMLFQLETEEIKELNDKNNVIKNLLRYMKQKDLPHDIQSRVKNYLEWLTDSQQIAKTFEQQVKINKKYLFIIKQLVENISANLKKEIINLINGKMIKNMQFLSTRFSISLLSQLAFRLEEQIYCPEETVFLESDIIQNDYNQRKLFYIVNGSVEIFSENTKTSFSTLVKGDCFGQIGFFANLPRSASVRSLDFVNFMVLSRQSFLNEATKSSDKEIFHQIKYTIENQNNLSDLQIKCFGCEQLGHVIKYCPQIHFVINQDERIKIIQGKQRKLIDQIKELRMKKPKKNSWILLKSFKEDKYFQKFMLPNPNQSLFRMGISGQYQQSSSESSESNQSEYECHAEENENNEQFVTSCSSIKKQKKILKDSFDIERIKEFQNFQPDNNLNNVTFISNSSAQQLINEIKQRKMQKMKELFVHSIQQKQNLKPKDRLINAVHIIMNKGQAPVQMQNRLQEVQKQRISNQQKAQKKQLMKEQLIYNFPQMRSEQNQECTFIQNGFSFRPQTIDDIPSCREGKPQDAFRIFTTQLTMKRSFESKISLRTQVRRMKCQYSKSMDHVNNKKSLLKDLTIHRKQILLNMYLLQVTNGLKISNNQKMKI